ncbi:hypothetical protein [Acinetobacter sp.]|uniref:hypothetical protein n=1 Tax=Acinetobacter sp. TaxID=472 RepID=UPI003D030822
MITEETKKRIDDMDYETMLSLWRFSPAGHPMFQGETGDYFAKVMAKKREQIGNDEHARTSKRIGWSL